MYLHLPRIWGFSFWKMVPMKLRDVMFFNFDTKKNKKIFLFFPTKMPFRRTNAKRSTKRSYKPKMSRRRSKRSSYRLNKSYAYKRMGKSTVVYNSTTAGQILTNDNTMISLSAAPQAEVGNVGYAFGAAMNFRAANVQTFADFSALYDQYKITGVSVKIIPCSDSATAQSSGFLPTLYYARDQDESAVPATEADLRERQDVKAVRLTKPVKIWIPNPKLQVDINQTTGLPDPAMVATGWINCANTLAQHNGLKMWFKNVDLRVQPTTITAFRVESTYYLKFRNPQ